MESASSLSEYDFKPLPQVAAWVGLQIEAIVDRLPGARKLQQRMLNETGTRLPDWVDHVALPIELGLVNQLRQLGFVAPWGEDGPWRHVGGMFPTILLHDAPETRLAIKVESVADFMMAHRLVLPALGRPLDAIRYAYVTHEGTHELIVVERHGCPRVFPATVGAFVFNDPDLPDDEHCLSDEQARSVLVFAEGLSQRLRDPDDEETELGFEMTENLIELANGGELVDVDEGKRLGIARTCDLFFAAERAYWQTRNLAARIQKLCQDRLGLGWANHDHHTYRSSREYFPSLIRVLERLGFVCRERFYAGREAGWGAQVLEQPDCGLVVFADVDLAPDEVVADFAHEPLAERDQLGTVGLWCELHGEAFLQAGMHHLECQFDFDAARDQLAANGVETMQPFTDFPYLKQAFTVGENWPVDANRIDRLARTGRITAEQAERFRGDGAIGSHLEILQRDDGYKGFNQTGISHIIAETDPRRER